LSALHRVKSMAEQCDTIASATFVLFSSSSSSGCSKVLVLSLVAPTFEGGTIPYLYVYPVVWALRQPFGIS
jgi:hypothetical protein